MRSPWCVPTSTHCAPALESCSLAPQHAVSCASDSAQAGSSPRMPTVTSSGEILLVLQSQLMSHPLGSHPLHASGHGGLLLVTPGLCAQCQGKGLMQSNLSDRVGSSVLGLHFLFPSLNPDTWEKVGRKEEVGHIP